MAFYEKKTWETLNLPVVSGDTYFTIFNRQTSTPGDDFNGRIYSGLCLDGYGIENVNEILSQYVNPAQIAFTSSVQQDNNSHSTFYIYYTQDDWETFTSDTVTLTYDWSYTVDARALLSEPIVNLVDYRQFLLSTVKAGTPDVSTTVYVTLDGSIIDSFGITGYTYYNYIQDLSTLDYGVTVPAVGSSYTLSVGGSTYVISNTCYRYCLYYLNQYGGWDSLLFRGVEMKSDDLSRLSYKKNYVANSTDFHKVDYLTTLSEKWRLNTSYLNDIESSRMVNLMASNRIYIHDLETGLISPVNITNSTCEHKTYKNQGRKMATYTIEVSASQPKYRI